MIYKLRTDHSKFLNFYIDAMHIELMLGDFFLLDKPIWTDFWQPLHVTFSDDSDDQNVIAVPDVAEWFGHNCLGLNQRAYEVLKPHLETCGELLPVQCEGIPYWVFHSTLKTGMEHVDLANSASTTDETGFINTQALVFKEETLTNKLIFQTEFNNYRNMYCTEEFKSLVESASLKGLYFSTDVACVIEP